MTSYDLSKAFWDFAFENPSKIKPIHCAIYFFSIEHCNRLGWKKEFGLPTSMVIEAVGVKSYSVYKKAFDELVLWNFFEVIQYSKNQYSSNIVALKENTKANVKALSKALYKHDSKHTSKQCQSTVSINKHITNIPITSEQERKEEKNTLSEIGFLVPVNLIESYMTSETQIMWFEQYCMNNHMKPEELKTKIHEYVKDLRDKNITEKDKKDLFIHFSNFVNSGKRNFKPSGPANQEPGTFKGLATKRTIKSAL